MFLPNRMTYDGMLIHQRFAYQYFRQDVSPLGNILIFRGAMEVLAAGMIDQEDVLNEAFIWSDDALNICWELPMLGNNAFAAVAYQRLFNTQIANLLAETHFLNKPVVMRGDDIMVHHLDHGQEKWGKCSVSITHIKDHAALGHTGINIHAGAKAPAFAYSTELSEQQLQAFIPQIISTFQTLNHDMFVATSKIIS